MEQFNIGEAVKEAESSIDSETPAAESEQDTQESVTDTANEAPAKEQVSDDFSSDPEYSKYVTKEIKSIPVKRFNEVYKKMRDWERKATREMSNDELMDLARQRNLIAEELEEAKQDLPPQQQKQVEQAYDLENLTDDQRRLDKYVDWKIAQRLQGLEPKFQTYDKFLNETKQEKSYNQLLGTEKQAQELVSKMGLDWENQVVPGVKKLIAEKRKMNPEWGQGLDVVDVTKMYLADLGPEIGKRQAQKETQALNEKKKQVQMETEGGKASGAALPESASLRDIVKAGFAKYTD